MKRVQRGFTVIEIAIALVVVGALVFGGYWVWHTQYNKNTSTSSSSSPSSTQKYLIISQWGVWAPYSDSDTFSYTTSVYDTGDIVSVISKQLVDTYDCDKGGGGRIIRLTPDQAIISGGISAAQYAAQNPETLGHVGDFYFEFIHDSAPCAYFGDAEAQKQKNDAATKAQNQKNDAVEAIVPKLEAMPQ